MKKMLDGQLVDMTQAEIDQIAIDAASPPSVPQSISPRQARLALLAAGLLDNVETAIAASPRSVQLAWEFSISVMRDDPILTAMAAQMGLTDAQMDDLFRQAAAL